MGKTTLLLDLAREFGERALYLACDGPEARLAGFWERLWARAEELARAEAPGILLLDELQQVTDWAGRLKGEWDRLRRLGIPLHVVVTGSSALRLAHGRRESLAGRFERLSLTHWTAAALVEAFGLAPAEAVDHYVRMGSYPGAFPLRAEPDRFRAYVHDAIVEPAVGRDLLALAPVRKPALLRQILSVAASSPAEIVSLQKIQGRLIEAGALETIASYLELLEEAFLVTALEKHSDRVLRRRAAPPKLICLSNAFLAALDPRGFPEPATERSRFGTWVENACLAHAVNSGQRVTYWREEPLEVDGVIEGSWGCWAVEVKTGPIHGHELAGLAEFTRRFPRFRPLLLSAPEDRIARGVAERAGFHAQGWDEFLLSGPPGRVATEPAPHSVL